MYWAPLFELVSFFTPTIRFFINQSHRLSATALHQQSQRDAAEMNDDEDHRRNAAVAVPMLDFHRLEVISALGRGAKGVVFLVKKDDDDDAAELMALKVISKNLIHRKTKDSKIDGGDDEYRRVCFEQKVLRRFDHPLLPKLHGVVDTEKLVGYAIDYCPGRDLNCLRKRQTERMFSDDVIRFYAAELVLVLEHLHGIGVVYRDLKPENIMIQETGHIMLVDFDLSTELSPLKTPDPARTTSNSAAKSTSARKNRRSPFSRFCNSGISPEDSVEPEHPGRKSEKIGWDPAGKSNSFVGTEEYVAPEIVSGDGHDFGVDWWSLGVLIYEMLYGTTPFRGSNRKETFYRILTKTPELTGETTALRDLIKLLLEKDPKRRIGSGEIKAHDFFKGVDWDSVLRVSRPPYIPVAEGTEGISKKIDVETVVEGIFGDDGGGGENKGDEEKRNINNGNNESHKSEESEEKKREWVEGLNKNPTHDDSFLVF